MARVRKRGQSAGQCALPLSSQNMQANTLIFGSTPSATLPGATTTILVGVNNTDNPPSILYLDGAPPEVQSARLDFKP